MATMVCRGLQSCLVSNLVDKRTFIFPPFELPAGILSSGAGDGGWSFLQSLTGGDPPASNQESVYVHPLEKRFNPTGLSQKSLELCTENLGNETGSDIIENNIFSPETDGEDLQRKWERKSHLSLNACLSSYRFPPPLTTIRDTEWFRVRPHREEGRLIITAERIQARLPCFASERSGGRLRLCFVKTERKLKGRKKEMGTTMEV